MRLLALTDLHGDLTQMRASLDAAGQVDAVAFAGDFSSRFDRTVHFIEHLAYLKDRGIESFLVHGNHDDHLAFTALCEQWDVHFLHGSCVSWRGIPFFGFGGGGFSRVRSAAERFCEELSARGQGVGGVFLSHAPPHGTRLDELFDAHVGDASIRRLIERVRPAVALSGHLHENFGVYDRLGDTVLFNPGPRGAVIEVRGTGVRVDAL